MLLQQHFQVSTASLKKKKKYDIVGAVLLGTDASEAASDM
jgi:hypothetical protein